MSISLFRNFNNQSNTDTVTLERFEENRLIEKFQPIISSGTPPSKMDAPYWKIKHVDQIFAGTAGKSRIKNLATAGTPPFLFHQKILKMKTQVDGMTINELSDYIAQTDSEAPRE